ncbi:MAG: hypothetical protein ACD_39C00076G0002 [uncultured bacterium]|nr:MAG: hypothetical protein ACD_39C00076G0002 [uncultured bacterium]
MPDIIDQQTLELSGHVAEISIEANLLHGLMESLINGLVRIEHTFVKTHHVLFARH